MAYHKPFTPQQHREAIKEFRSWQANLRLLRFSFPPGTRAERRAFREYRLRVREVGRLIMQLRHTVEVDELNDRVARARNAMIQYFQIRHLGPWR